MADTTKRRGRKAAKRIERQRRAALAARNPVRPTQGPGAPGREIGQPDLFPPGWPDDLDGGAGVREPRRPFPGMPTGAISLDVPQSQYLDLVG